MSYRTWNQSSMEQVRDNLTTLSFELVGSGRHRETWRRGNCVIKIPLCNYGVEDNWQERKLWLKYRTTDKDDVQYARCRLIANWLLMMEYVEPYHRTKCFQDLPKWTHYIDCGQVGFNRRGKLLAYDYGVG